MINIDNALRPLVSAVITTHNRIDFLKRAVRSVLNQSYDNIECIVINDASDDGTKEWLDTLTSSEIKIVNLDKSFGGNHARNIGIKISRGYYIAFLDDDDFWLPSKIEIQMNALFSHPEVKIATCGLYKTDGKKVYITRFGDDAVASDFSKKIFEQVPAVTSSLIIWKELFERTGLFDENVKYWQEYELLIRMAQYSGFVEINSPLVIYWTGKQDKKRLTNNIDGFEKNFEYITEKHKDKIRRLSEKQINYWFINFYYDLASRYWNIGNKKMHKKALYFVWKREKTLKSFLRFLFNINYSQLVNIYEAKCRITNDTRSIFAIEEMDIQQYLDGE